MTIVCDSPEYIKTLAKEWRQESLPILIRWIRARGQKNFTTRDIWPLLDAPPGDMRVMGALMGDLVRRGHAVRVGVELTPADATTKNGVTFPYNRPITVFRAKA